MCTFRVVLHSVNKQAAMYLEMWLYLFSVNKQAAMYLEMWLYLFL